MLATLTGYTPVCVWKIYIIGRIRKLYTLMHTDRHLIESIKTTSKENVSTGALEKKRTMFKK